MYWWHIPNFRTYSNVWGFILIMHTITFKYYLLLKCNRRTFVVKATKFIICSIDKNRLVICVETTSPFLNVIYWLNLSTVCTYNMYLQQFNMCCCAAGHVGLFGFFWRGFALLSLYCSSCVLVSLFAYWSCFCISNQYAPKTIRFNIKIKINWHIIYWPMNFNVSLVFFAVAFISPLLWHRGRLNRCTEAWPY